MYNDTITLFNRHKSSSGDMWYPTVLSSVNLNIDKAAIIAKYGTEAKDNAVLNVRYRMVDGNRAISDKIWLPPKEWSRQSEDMLRKSLTFADGQTFSFFYAGEWLDTEPISDNDYAEGFFNYAKCRYDYVFAITSVSIYKAIPHFEIMGA